MIRPFTLVCMLMAGASGLYLYQSKHRAQMLDREIARTIKQTEQTRAKIDFLTTEWNELSQPERIADLARAHLPLRPIETRRWITADVLGQNLPAPIVPGATKPPTDAEPDPGPAIAQVTPPQAPARLVAVAATPEPKAAVEPRSSTQTMEPKPARAREAAKPAVLTAAPAPHPTALAPIMPVGVSSAATAPGTVGEAVLRAMRANAAASAPPPPVSTPQAAYVQPIRAAQATMAPAYAGPAYATQATSLLGGSRGTLPPPVPFAGR